MTQVSSPGNKRLDSPRVFVPTKYNKIRTSTFSQVKPTFFALLRHFQWRKTTSCSLDQAMLFDVNIYPRDGHNITALLLGRSFCCFERQPPDTSRYFQNDLSSLMLQVPTLTSRKNEIEASLRSSKREALWSTECDIRRSSLPSVQTISHALNRSFAANGIDKVATGPVQAGVPGSLGHGS